MAIEKNVILPATGLELMDYCLIIGALFTFAGIVIFTVQKFRPEKLSVPTE